MWSTSCFRYFINKGSRILAPFESTGNSNKIKLIFFFNRDFFRADCHGIRIDKKKFHIDPEVIQKGPGKIRSRSPGSSGLMGRHSAKRRRVRQRNLEIINSFFNKRIAFVNDTELYGEKDYWATPVEFLSERRLRTLPLPNILALRCWAWMKQNSNCLC